MKNLLTFLILIITLSALSQKPLPELWGLHVHDDAHVLSQQTVDNLESQLKSYEDSTSNQIAILVISSLDGEVLEDYALRVAEKWRLGQKEKDNGALLLIAIDDHKMRIEAGQGLEGVLTDAVSSRIIRNEMAPNFRKNDYDAGVTIGINKMISAIGGEYKADETLDVGAAELSLKQRILIGIFIFGVLSIFTFIGLFVPGFGGWFMYAFLTPFYAIFPIIIFGLVGGLISLGIYAIGFPVLRTLINRSPWGKEFSKKMASTNKNTTGGQGWTSGGGWTGGGGSGGGFSGGGGSFGGGGSSGSW